MRRHPFLDGAYPRAMVHRGWHADGLPENTLSAFSRAVAEGYDYVETDVRASADGVPVLHHDARLRGAGPVREMPWAQVQRFSLGSGERVPSLAEALAALPTTRFNLDVKSDDAVPGVLDTLDAADALPRVCLASFSDARLRRLRAVAGPRLLTALGPASVLALRARSVLPVGLPAQCAPRGDVAQVPTGPRYAPLVDRRLLREAHRQGREVHVWTVDDADEMRRLLALGVDGIITDAPRTLRDVLEAVGRWRPRR